MLRVFIFANLIGVWLCFSTGCGEGNRAKSPARLQAESVHESMISKSESLHADIAAGLIQTERAVDEWMSQGDTVRAMVAARIGSQLSELDVRFHDWSATMVEIPGHAHTHGDHDHDHGDHEGHHHHHGTGPNLEGLSDDEILAIQMALDEELGKLIENGNRIQGDWHQIADEAGFNLSGDSGELHENHDDHDHSHENTH